MSALLVALNGPVPLSILIPFAYILIAAGITFMLQQWFTVFPRNPVAKNIGVAIMTLAVVTTTFYHINHYYVAWPNAPQTIKTYNQQL
jgi:uncharacterized protein YqhQ